MSREKRLIFEGLEEQEVVGNGDLEKACKWVMVWLEQYDVVGLNWCILLVDWVKMIVAKGRHDAFFRLSWKLEWQMMKCIIWACKQQRLASLPSQRKKVFLSQSYSNLQCTKPQRRLKEQKERMNPNDVAKSCRKVLVWSGFLRNRKMKE